MSGVRRIWSPEDTAKLAEAMARHPALVGRANLLRDAIEADRATEGRDADVIDLDSRR